MRIWRFHEFGSPRVLQLDEIDRPAPQAGEVLVRMQYAALNPADIFTVLGQYPGVGALPLAIGRDGCGVVEQAPAGSRFTVGRQVVFISSQLGVKRNGTMAEYVVAPEEVLAPLPDGWTAQEGAAGVLVHLTAAEALVHQGQIEPGANVLITGASGGVGTASLMQAKAHGAHVVALSRSEKKRTRLLELGADAALDPSADDLLEQIRAAFGDAGADIVIENIAGPALNQSIAACNPNGRICLIGMLGGVQPSVNLPEILFKSLQLRGVYIGQYSPEHGQRIWLQVVALLDRAGRKPLIDKEFPFESLVDACRYLRTGPMGKVLIGPITND